MNRTTTMISTKRIQLAAALAAFALSLPALSLQPLQAFVASAHEKNPDALEATANVRQRQALADFALDKQLPGITAFGTFTKNQYESTLDLAPPGAPPNVVTIVAGSQFDAAATLRVPLIDIAAFERIASARTSTKAATAQLEAVRLQIEAQVVQSYYQLVANLALVTASRQALDVSRANFKLANDRFQAGASPELEADRARADVEQQVQQVASAELQVSLAARALESQTGLAADVAQTIRLDDDLHPEQELPAFEKALDTLPALQAARETTNAAQQDVQAGRYAAIPTLAGSFTERGTSAAGFTGHDFTWQAALTLSWAFDLGYFSNVKVQQAAVDAARARELRARLVASDSIHRQWNTVLADIARSRSARAGREAAQHASTQARDRYQAGAATQLDLLQAQRDAFTADVALIQANADLVNARTQLRLAAGQRLEK